MSQSINASNESESSNAAARSYHDHANDLEEESNIQNHLVELSLYRPSDQNFTARLHRLLSCTDKEGISHIISWQPHGRSFLVHHKQQFEQQVMPRWFQQSSMSSFLRQLNLYEFTRLYKGRDKGGYYHEFFLRTKPALCRRIKRTRIKGKGGRKPHESEPDFYQMIPLPSDENGPPHSDLSVIPQLSGGSAQSFGQSVASLESRGLVCAEMVTRQEAQQVASSQAFGLWLQEGDNHQSTSPSASSPWEATLTCSQKEWQGSMESDPTNLSTCGLPPNPSSNRDVENSRRMYRYAHAMPHSYPPLTSTQREFLGSPDLPPGNQGSIQGDNLLESLGLYSAARAAPVFEAGIGQSMSSQPAASTLSPPQPQSLLDPSRSTSHEGATLPGFLAALFEPTPFPQLPSHPPPTERHDHVEQRGVLLLGSRQQLFNDDTSRSMANPPDPDQSFQSLNPYLRGTSDPFTGIQTPQLTSQGLPPIFPNPTIETDRESDRLYQQPYSLHDQAEKDGFKK